MTNAVEAIQQGLVWGTHRHVHLEDEHTTLALALALGDIWESLNLLRLSALLRSQPVGTNRISLAVLFTPS